MSSGQDAVIAGVGETEYSKRSGRSEQRLGMEAILAACRDAELDPRQIDGFIAYPFGLDAEEVVSGLGLHALRVSATVHMGGASAVAALAHAVRAVADGTARHVAIVRAKNGYSGDRIQERPSQLPTQRFRQQLEEPYGWNSAAQRYAFMCRRYQHEYGLTREQLGAVAVAARRHAQRNPRAQMYGRELALADYLAGRVIADPYTLFDCCLETDGGCAIVVSAREHAIARPHDARVLSVAEGRPHSPDDLTNRDDLLEIGLASAAPRAWESAGVGPADMDAAMIYDCFTFQALHQLEAAGFVGPGGAGRFVEEGHTALGGSLPMNTHGGLLSEGHLAGLNHVIEAARQLRGECGDRQVADARHIAVTGWGDLGDGALAVLDRVGPR
ncbi:MAG TPA: transporter [Acidimicrobiia bacterium]|nr:transporter [Acidimicrobiia bacterium]